MQEYPTYKLVLWRCLRSFVSGFLASAATILILVDREMFADVSTFVNTVLISIMIAGIAGGLNGLGLALREMFGDKQYKSAVYSIPF